MKRLSIVLALILPLVLAGPASAQEPDKEEPGRTEPGSVPPDYAGGIFPGEIETTVDGEAVDAVPAGRRARVAAKFVNNGEKGAQDVKVTLDPADSQGLRIVDGTATLGDLSPQESATAVFVVDVLEAGCEQDFAAFGATITSSLGEEPTKLGFPVLCPGPRLWMSSFAYKGGDEDNVAEPGERLEVFVTLHNAGRDAATGVRGSLTLTGEGVKVIDGDGAWPNIASGKDAAPSDPFVIEIADGAKVQEGCPDIFVEDQPMSIRPLPAEETKAEEQGGGSEPNSGTEPSGDTPTSDSGTTMIAPDGPTGSDGTDGSDGREPAPAPDAGVAFDAKAVVTTAGKSFDIPFGNAMYCAMEMRSGDKSAQGAPEPATLDSQELAGAREESTGAGRGGPIAIALLLLAVAAAVLVRVRLSAMRAVRHSGQE